MSRIATLAGRLFGGRTTDSAGLAHSFRLLVVMGLSRGTLFAAFLLLLRRMDSVQFGTFFLGYNTLAFIPLVTDFGIAQTFVRHISFYRSSRPGFAAYLYRLFFVLKISSASVIAALAWIVVPLLAKFLHLEDQKPLLTVAIVGSGAIVLFEFVNSVFQSGSLFRRYELNLFLKNTFFLAAVVLLVMLKPHFLTATVLIVCLVLINAGLVVGAYPFLTTQWRNRNGSFSDFRGSLLRYSGWLTVATICFAIYRRIDVYYLSHFRNLGEVGVYSVAVVLVEPVAMISPALVTVFLPRLSADPSSQRIGHFIGMVGLVCAMVALGGCIYAGALRAAFPWLGAQYRAAFPIFALLLLGTVFLIGYNMLSLIFLAADRPEMFGSIALAMAGFSVVANWFAVPAYGTLGAAGVYGLSQFIGIALAALFIRNWARRGILFERIEAGLAIPTESVLT